MSKSCPGQCELANEGGSVISCESMLRLSSPVVRAEP